MLEAAGTGSGDGFAGLRSGSVQVLAAEALEAVCVQHDM
jgi:hypothetical protein